MANLTIRVPNADLPDVLDALEQQWSKEASRINPLYSDLTPAERASACIGAYPDLCHMGLEGGRSGWKQGLDLLGDRINMLGVKNAGLYPETDAEGKTRWQGKLVPVWEGLTPFPQAFSYLKQVGFDGPCSFHSEYQGSFSFKDMTTQELIEQTREDLKYVRQVLADLAAC